MKFSFQLKILILTNFFLKKIFISFCLLLIHVCLLWSFMFVFIFSNLKIVISLMKFSLSIENSDFNQTLSLIATGTS